MATQSGMLKIVNRHFPKVTQIKDAEKSLLIEVTSDDDKKSKRMNKNECAMAVACKRAYHADGVILSRSVAYLIKGNLAVRFYVPTSVAREITSFDRGAGFMPGTYQLSKPKDRLGRKRKNLKPDRERDNKNIRVKHYTTNIRTILGSVDD